MIKRWVQTPAPDIRWMLIVDFFTQHNPPATLEWCVMHSRWAREVKKKPFTLFPFLKSTFYFFAINIFAINIPPSFMFLLFWQCQWRKHWLKDDWLFARLSIHLPSCKYFGKSHFSVGGLMSFTSIFAAKKKDSIIKKQKTGVEVIKHFVIFES